MSTILLLSSLDFSQSVRPIIIVGKLERERLLLQGAIFFCSVFMHNSQKSNIFMREQIDNEHVFFRPLRLDMALCTPQLCLITKVPYLASLVKKKCQRKCSQKIVLCIKFTFFSAKSKFPKCIFAAACWLASSGFLAILHVVG